MLQDGHPNFLLNISSCINAPTTSSLLSITAFSTEGDSSDNHVMHCIPSLWTSSRFPIAVLVRSMMERREGARSLVTELLVKSNALNALASIDMNRVSVCLTGSSTIGICPACVPLTNSNNTITCNTLKPCQIQSGG